MVVMYNIFYCEMCMKILPKKLFANNSYSVTKVLLRQVNVATSTRESHRARLLGPFLMCRNYSTHAETQTNVQNDTSSDRSTKNRNTSGTSKTNMSNKLLNKMMAYMNSKPSRKSIMDGLPEKLLKPKRKPDALYIIDEDVAKKLVEKIQHDVVNTTAPVYETNPGIGLVSRKLLAAGVQRLCLCEPSPYFSQQMKDLKNEFPERVKFFKTDLISLGKLAFQDGVDGGSRVQDIFQEVSKANWTDDPVMKIIGIMPTQKFIRYLIQSHIFQTGAMSYGRIEFYLIMSPQLYFYLTCKPSDGNFHYRSITVLFQLIFQWSLLDKLPRKAFLPWEIIPSVKKWSKLTKVRSIDPELVYLVKVVPRLDFFKSVVPLDQLIPLWYFVRHHLISRTCRVIPQLEKWIPGCGPRIIAEGMTIHTQFGDLTPQEILSVFKNFISWPEYPVCPFLASMETTVMKMEAGGYDIGKESDDDDDDDDVGDEEEEVDEDDAAPEDS